MSHPFRDGIAIAVVGILIGLGFAYAQGPKPSSYMPVVITEDFAATMTKMKAAKADVMKRQRDLLNARYDLADRPAAGVTMARGKPVQDGVRVKLPAGVSWDQLGQTTADDIKSRNLFPAGFLPLPHANHPEGGMVFPQRHIDEIKRQEGRDLTRFDLDFDLPDHLTPEFPPPMFITTRLDLGDVSKGKLGIDGKLDPAKATDAEKRGQALFFGKAQCATCHPAPYYTDNLMHNLRTERFFRPQLINGRMAAMDGPIKTFPLRGIKDSPPYMHDGRLLTLDDTVEFFNLVLGVKLTEPEKKDLVAFLRAL